MKLSLVVPVYNESENILLLIKEIEDVATTNNYDYEIIFVNDGSKDGSLVHLKNAAARDPRIKVIDFKFNTGQTAAMSAGVHYATGDVVVTLDADLQNDPADIPLLLTKMDEGFDVVSGWRKNRKDTFINRTLPSRVANYTIGKVTGVHLHDYGCTLKAYNAEMLKGIHLYGEMHRFIPAYMVWQGGALAEVVVNHRPRVNGVTKYGISRTFKVLLDLVVLKFLFRYMRRPMHFFGGVGFASLFLGVVAGATSLIFKFTGYKTIVETPLPTFSAMLVIIGVQFILMGVIAEMIIRVYYESQQKTPHIVKETVNL